MARLGRYFLPDRLLHVIQRGDNHDAIFGDVQTPIVLARHWRRIRECA